MLPCASLCRKRAQEPWPGSGGDYLETYTFNAWLLGVIALTA
jgi:hypothetical protein